MFLRFSLGTGVNNEMKETKVTSKYIYNNLTLE